MDIDTLIKTAGEVMNLHPDLITSSSRERMVIIARRVIFKILREEQDMTFSQIGKNVGGKDHATVIHNLNIFDEQYKFNYNKQVNYYKIIRSLYLSNTNYEKKKIKKKNSQVFYLTYNYSNL